MKRAVLIGTAGTLAVVLLVAGVALLARVVDDGPEPTGGAPTDVEVVEPRPEGPGAVVSARTMPALDGAVEEAGITAVRLEYRSTEGDTGASTVVSGTAFLPPGKPPRGGWPVVAFGHGSTGISAECAPSRSTDLAGQVSGVLILTDLGYAVTIADYQGLGAAGTHPYLDSRTAGYNVIDSVRAARSVFGSARVSDRWGALGVSQGGGAVWSANEQADAYAPELQLVGTGAVVPATDTSGIVDRAEDGELTTDQVLVYPSIIESLARLDPSIDRDDYRRGAAARAWAELTGCAGQDVKALSDAVGRIGPTDLAPSDDDAADVVRDRLERWAVPQGPLTAPLSISFAGADTVLDRRWTLAALRRACRLGGSVEWRELPDAGHATVPVDQELGWLVARFQGDRARSDCP